MKKAFRFFVFIPLTFVLIFCLDSCKLLNSSNMLHANRKFVYDTLLNDSTVAKEFRLGPNDIIEFRLFANDGYKMIDVVQTNAANGLGSRQLFEYPLDNQGVVKLPILGSENLNGMSIREAEEFLVGRYSEYYVKPFVTIKVLNKRIIVFPGEPGKAQVVTLVNNNTTVLEALAIAGGISANGKAYNIKLIRRTNNPKKPTKVYKIDLSDINNIEQGNTIVQSDDIIYVEPRQQIAKRTLSEVTPVLTLITSFLTFYYIITRP